MEKRVWVGCSGYYYREWRGRFYPPGLRPADWLAYYAERFDTVEINSTFYRSPSRRGLLRWKAQVPERFRFSLKAPRSISHHHKFSKAEKLRAFYDVVGVLAERLAVILFQLPPLAYDPALLERILALLDPTFKNALEFRHASWWRESVFFELSKAGVAFVGVSAPGLPGGLPRTASFAYLRLHGQERWYDYDYSKAELHRWLRALRFAEASEAYVYFNNDRGAAAPRNARLFKSMLEAA